MSSLQEMSRQRSDARIQRLVSQRLDTDEKLLEWTRVWHSRPGRLHIFAARYRDIAVLTDARLILFDVGWLTRRPRRRVLADRLSQLTVEDASKAKDASKIRFARSGRRSMLLEFKSAAPFGVELLQRSGRIANEIISSGTK